jgi:hypothetical protein
MHGAGETITGLRQMYARTIEMRQDCIGDEEQNERCNEYSTSGNEKGPVFVCEREVGTGRSGNKRAPEENHGSERVKQRVRFMEQENVPHAGNNTEQGTINDSC